MPHLRVNHPLTLCFICAYVQFKLLSRLLNDRLDIMPCPRYTFLHYKKTSLYLNKKIVYPRGINGIIRQNDINIHLFLSLHVFSPRKYETIDQDRFPDSCIVLLEAFPYLGLIQWYSRSSTFTVAGAVLDFYEIPY